MDDNKQDNVGFWNCICQYFSHKETVRETIEDLIEEAGGAGEHCQFSEHEQLLLNNILYLKDKKCSQVMVPRAEIIAFQKDGNVEELAKLMIERGHSRIPVYGETLDDILGIVHIIDVAKYLMKGNNKIKAENLISNKVKFVSPAMRVLDLLRDMQKNKVHIAMVVDEYGGIDGLVTIEDLLEEIVGDIEDEYDIDVEPEITIQSKNVIIADAKAELTDLEEKTGLNLRDNIEEDDEGEVDTLGGLVFLMIERVPQRGEVIEGKNGIRFRILDVDSRHIKKIMIVKKNEDNVDGDSEKN